MKSILKKTTSFFLVFSILITGFGVDKAFAKEASNLDKSMDDNIYISDYLDNENITFMKKLEKIYPYFTFDSSGSLKLKKDLKELKSQYNLDNEFIKEVNKIMEENKSSKDIYSLYSKRINNSFTTFVSVKDWKVYFTYDEVVDLFLAAASIGPAALVASLSALGTSIGGPVGGAIAAIVGYVSGADFMYLVLRASAMEKGIYIGIDWDGNFPVYTQGTW